MTVRITLVLALTFAGSSSWAEEIKTGYLIIEGRQIDAPHKVEISAGRVLANGIQIYPHVSSPREIAEQKEKKDARELLASMHEQFVVKKKRGGHVEAVNWLKVELKKHQNYRNAMVREGKMGVEVNLKGITDLEELRDNIEYVRHMREDNVPSQQNQFNLTEERLARNYEQLREQFGKEAALNQLETELKKEPLVEQFKIDREHESYWVRWKGRPYGGSVGLRAQGRRGRELTRQEKTQQALRYQASEIADPLKRNECVVVLAGGAYSSNHGKTACEDVLQIFRDRPGKEHAMAILSRHFSGREQYIWRRITHSWR